MNELCPMLGCRVEALTPGGPTSFMLMLVAPASAWPHERLERVLAERADHLVGGPDAVLVVDDTALVKQERPSVGVQRQSCSASIAARWASGRTARRWCP